MNLPLSSGIHQLSTSLSNNGLKDGILNEESLYGKEIPTVGMYMQAYVHAFIPARWIHSNYHLKIKATFLHVHASSVLCSRILK